MSNLLRIGVFFLDDFDCARLKIEQFLPHIGQEEQSLNEGVEVASIAHVLQSNGQSFFSVSLVHCLGLMLQRLLNCLAHLVIDLTLSCGTSSGLVSINWLGAAVVRVLTILGLTVGWHGVTI